MGLLDRGRQRDAGADLRKDAGDRRRGEVVAPHQAGLIVGVGACSVGMQHDRLGRAWQIAEVRITPVVDLRAVKHEARACAVQRGPGLSEQVDARGRRRAGRGIQRHDVVVGDRVDSQQERAIARGADAALASRQGVGIERPLPDVVKEEGER